MVSSLLEERKAKAEIEVAELEAAHLRLRIETLQRELDVNGARSQSRNVYHLFGDVTTESMRDAYRDVSEWARRLPDEPITFVISSPGGSVLAGLALYDKLLSLREQGHTIITIGTGMVASMGGVLFQAGSQRIMHRNAQMLIHKVREFQFGSATLDDLADKHKFLEKMNARLFDILAERATISREEIETEAFKTDWWLSADEALKFGLCDVIE